ncbi:hypothetical protein BN871_AU_00010, partial [Paenibacillus sp. P22]
YGSGGGSSYGGNRSSSRDGYKPRTEGGRGYEGRSYENRSSSETRRPTEG